MKWSWLSLAFLTASLGTCAGAPTDAENEWHLCPSADRQAQLAKEAAEAGWLVRGRVAAVRRTKTTDHMFFGYFSGYAKIQVDEVLHGQFRARYVNLPWGVYWSDDMTRRGRLPDVGEVYFVWRRGRDTNGIASACAPDFTPRGR